MANDFEQRLGRLEDRFDEYMTIFYRWLDELRTDHELSKKKIEENERRIEQNERRIEQTELLIHNVRQTQTSHGELISRIVDTQGNIIELIDRMDQKLDRIDEKINSLLNPGTNGKH